MRATAWAVEKDKEREPWHPSASSGTFSVTFKGRSFNSGVELDPGDDASAILAVHYDRHPEALHQHAESMTSFRSLTEGLQGRGDRENYACLDDCLVRN